MTRMNISPEILRRVRRLHIVTSRLVQDVFVGPYHAAFKGRGVEFEEVRAYQPGDDVRTIDWNVTARTGRPHVKTYREERELTVLLLVDVSGSQRFGTRDRSKTECVAELAATLALAALQNNDKVGLVLFSDRIERFVPPRKGLRHTLRIVRDLLVPAPAGDGTDVGGALEYVHRLLHRPAVLFVISDFLCDGFERPLRIACRRHDLIPIVIQDPLERAWLSGERTVLQDAEGGVRAQVNLRPCRARNRFAAAAEAYQRELVALFDRLHLDHLRIATDESFIGPLIRFFRRREERR